MSVILSARPVWFETYTSDAIDDGPDQREKTVFTALHIAEITELCGIIVSPHIYILDWRKAESAATLRQI